MANVMYMYVDVRLLGWAYMPFIEMWAGFAGGAADLLCFFSGGGCGTVLYGYETPRLLFWCFVWGVYICRDDMLC